MVTSAFLDLCYAHELYPMILWDFISMTSNLSAIACSVLYPLYSLFRVNIDRIY